MEFFTGLWGDEEDAGGHILLWDPAAKASHWFRSASTAAAFASSYADRDLYVGVGLAPRSYGAEKRCPADEVSAISGLWADVDVAGACHAGGRRYPPDEASAGRVIESCGFRPTILVHSGHGLQPWWLFKEPWRFSDTQERTRAQALAKNWQRFLALKASGFGWEIDSTGDLARVLRVPGTTNLKDPLNPIAVRVLSNDGPRYSDPIDFESLISLALSPEVRAPEVNFALRGNAEPPKDKLELLAMTLKKFQPTWDRRRADFKDQSASAYCFSLAMFAVRAGWTDQETADLLVAWRRKEKEDLKLDRPDWYGKHTIARARMELKIEEAVDLMTSGRSLDGTSREDPKGAAGVDAPAEDPAKKRAAILEKVSTIMHANIAGLIQHGRESAIYSFLLVDGTEILVGPFEKLASVNYVQGRFYSILKVPLSDISPKQWRRILNHLLGVVIEVNPDVDDLTAETTRLIERFVWARQTIFSDEGEADNTDEAVARGLPFQRRGTLFIHAETFREFLEIRGEKRTLAEVRNLIRRLGFARKTIRDASTGSTKSYWHLRRDEFERGRGAAVDRSKVNPETDSAKQDT